MFKSAVAALLLLSPVRVVSSSASNSGSQSSSGVSSASNSGSQSSSGGLSDSGREKLEQAGFLQYVTGDFDAFEQAVQDPFYVDVFGFKKYTFVGGYSSGGPSCIAGTDYSLYVRRSNNEDTENLLIFLQGGGACWGGLNSCSVFAEEQSPNVYTQDIIDGEAGGIWEFENPDNPFKDYDVILAPYCDGSVWIGDNFVANDDAFDAYVTEKVSGFPPPFNNTFEPFLGGRNHGGLRNLSAVIQFAKGLFSNPDKITLMGHSAGGVGASIVGPALVRELFDEDVEFTVFNDAGPVAVNPDEMTDIAARYHDWNLAKLGGVCGEICDSLANPQAGISFIDWYLQKDSTVRMAFYSTVLDPVNAVEYFKINIYDVVEGNIEPNLAGIEKYASLLVSNYYVALALSHPNRYSVFIPFGDPTGMSYPHGAVQETVFYDLAVEGVTLRNWTNDFLDEDAVLTNLVDPSIL